MPLLPPTCDSIDAFTDDLCAFIRTPLVQQITGGVHVNDALIYDAWGALPPEWTSYWDSLPDHRLAQRDMIDAISDDAKATPSRSEIPQLESSDTTPPDSLKDWLTRLKSVSLPRTQRQGDALDLPENLILPMKTKKINEVSVASAYIHDVCKSNSITHIIDMGSGQGYLSATLAYLFPSLRVLAIDGSESQVAGSRAFASSLGISEDKLTHLVRYIDGSKPLIAEMQSWAGEEKCMLVGLHACGRLSEHMLRYFTTCPFITHLAAVGCCYNHIIPRSDTCPGGFPISWRMRERGLTLSPTALMTGCQAPNNWERSDLSKSPPVYSRKQLYRSILEKLFYDYGIQADGGAADGGDRPNWGIRKGDLVNFDKFARRAMHCLGVDQNRIPVGQIQQYEERYGCEEGRIAILWTLSVLCCKAVESVIALDRYWFLVEQGAEGVDIVPIFEYKISPRNLMMVAEKKAKDL